MHWRFICSLGFRTYWEAAAPSEGMHSRGLSWDCMCAAQKAGIVIVKGVLDSMLANRGPQFPIVLARWSVFQ